MKHCFVIAYFFQLLGLLQGVQVLLVLLSRFLHHVLHLLNSIDGSFNLFVQILLPLTRNLCQQKHEIWHS